jgi:hypothetical protein
MALGLPDPSNPSGVTSAFVRLSADWSESEEPDVAIAPLPEKYWALLRGTKGKRAIDLDVWQAPK